MLILVFWLQYTTITTAHRQA